jgi:hypothetical protein
VAMGATDRCVIIVNKIRYFPAFFHRAPKNRPPAARWATSKAGCHSGKRMTSLPDALNSKGCFERAVLRHAFFRHPSSPLRGVNTICCALCLGCLTHRATATVRGLKNRGSMTEARTCMGHANHNARARKIIDNGFFFAVSEDESTTQQVKVTALMAGIKGNLFLN